MRNLKTSVKNCIRSHFVYSFAFYNTPEGSLRILPQVVHEMINWIQNLIFKSSLYFNNTYKQKSLWKLISCSTILWLICLVQILNNQLFLKMTFFGSLQRKIKSAPCLQLVKIIIFISKNHGIYFWKDMAMPYFE